MSSRILLVDDSPHAQRMGERILSEEGYEVVAVSNADSALIRLDDVDPDVILADTVMPGRTGYEICHYVKMSPRHKHVRVILTAGVLEPLDEEQTKRVEADATIKKPFEASTLIAAVKPLADAAATARRENAPAGGERTGGQKAEEAKKISPFVAVVDAEVIRSAVIVALDASMEAMVEEITRQVMQVLAPKKSLEPPPLAPAHPEAAKPAAPPPAAPRVEGVRRVSPLRIRSGSILGLDIGRAEPETQPEAPPPSES